MIRISYILMLVFCVSIPIVAPTTHGQEAELMDSGATIRGEVIEVSLQQNPIEGVTVTIVNTGTDKTYTVTTDIDGVFKKTGLPPGRYTIAADKKGYGSRVGRSKVVAPGGEIFIPIKMRKNETLITFFLKRIFTGQFVFGLLVGFAIGFLMALILNSRPSHV